MRFIPSLRAAVPGNALRHGGDDQRLNGTIRDGRDSDRGWLARRLWDL